MPNDTKSDTSTQKVFKLIAAAVDHYIKTNERRGNHYANHLRITVSDPSGQEHEILNDNLPTSVEQPDSADAEIATITCSTPVSTFHVRQTFDEKHDAALAILHRQLEEVGIIGNEQYRITPSLHPIQIVGDEIPAIPGTEQPRTPTDQDEINQQLEVLGATLTLRSKF